MTDVPWVGALLDLFRLQRTTRAELYAPNRTNKPLMAQFQGVTRSRLAKRYVGRHNSRTSIPFHSYTSTMVHSSTKSGGPNQQRAN